MFAGLVVPVLYLTCVIVRLNEGGALKSSKTGVVYNKGSYYTTERIVNLGNKAYIGYAPVGMSKFTTSSSR